MNKDNSTLPDVPKFRTRSAMSGSSSENAANRNPHSNPRRKPGMISVQVPTSLCMQNKLIIHSRYCFVEQYVYPREPNIYMGNLYLRDE